MKDKMKEDKKEVDLEEELEKAANPVILRDNKGRILPGQTSLNPGGRSRSMKTAQAMLHKALKKVEKRRGKKFLEHYIEQAFNDKTLAVALLKKLVPDLKAVEVDSDTKEVWNVVLQTFNKKNKSIDDNVFQTEPVEPPGPRPKQFA